jgi:flagellar biosynthesis anti-sigma factor FlgM
MRIIDTYGNLGAGSLSGPAKATTGSVGSPAEKATDAAVQGAVNVTMSARALALADAAASGGTDDAKVSRLQSAIASGSLAIDSSRIAQRIVDGG